MQIELTEKEFRRLLDMAYIGNWILNSTRGSDRFEDYDKVESRLFSYCKDHGMASLTETWNGQPGSLPAFAEAASTRPLWTMRTRCSLTFWRRSWPARDMDYAPISNQNYDELIERMDEYMEEFRAQRNRPLAGRRFIIRRQEGCCTCFVQQPIFYSSGFSIPILWCLRHRAI